MDYVISFISSRCGYLHAHVLFLDGVFNDEKSLASSLYDLDVD